MKNKPVAPDDQEDLVPLLEASIAHVHAQRRASVEAAKQRHPSSGRHLRLIKSPKPK